MRRRELDLGLRAERGNLCFDVKREAKAAIPCKRESTDAGNRGKADCSSDEGSVMEVKRRGCIVRLQLEVNCTEVEGGGLSEAKLFCIFKHEIGDAYRRVRSNHGSYGGGWTVYRGV